MSNKILVLLCEGPKLNIFMISGFWSPGEPLFMDFNTPEIRKKYKRKGMDAILKHISFLELGILNFEKTKPRINIVGEYKIRTNKHENEKNQHERRNGNYQITNKNERK